MTTVKWAVFKAFVDARSLSIQYLEDDNFYFLKVSDAWFALECNLEKAVDTADVTEFEATYKADGNKKISGPVDSDGNPIFVSRPPKTIYVFQNLLRPSNQSRGMNVNGTLGAPIHFEFAPPPGEVWEIERLLFGLDDVGLTDMGLFGGISALTNGILITIKLGPTTYTVGNIKDNVDVSMMFQGVMAGQSGVLDTSDGIYGHLTFKDQIKLIGDNNDHIRMAVRDNLTGINILRSMVLARRIL